MRNRIVALGIGSNLGNSVENLRRALSLIRKSALFNVLSVSSIYESDAQLPENAEAEWQKKFLNAAILCSFNDAHSPLDLLAEVKKIEVVMGRKSSVHWAPRIIDIDLLYWDGETYFANGLTLPHARLFERPFALLPLLEIWPAKIEKIPSFALGWSGTQAFNTIKSSKVFWPRMVGILNVTEDSFSDGGRFLDSDKIVAQAEVLKKSGAEVIDVGAESTRPGARAVDLETEFIHLEVALTSIGKLGLKISLDCRNPEIVSRIMDKFDIDFLNDVTGFEAPKMRELLKRSGKAAFVMHSLGVPPEPQKTLLLEIDPLEQLCDWWKIRQSELLSLGIESDKLIFDPGIGFGKTKEQSLYILKNLGGFSKIKNDIMIGHSRKSFLTLISDRPAAQRDLETALVTQQLNQVFVQYLRVHDVDSQKAALWAGSIL